MIHYTFSCFCFSPLATKISSDFLCIFIIYMFLINFICKSLERISSTICHIHFFFFIYYRHFCFCFIMPNCHRTLWHHDSFCFLLSHSGHPLQWRHNERDGVPNHQPHDSLLHYLFRCRSKKTLKLGVTGEFTGDRWIPHTKDQLHGKCFHLMTSSVCCCTVINLSEAVRQRTPQQPRDFLIVYFFVVYLFIFFLPVLMFFLYFLAILYHIFHIIYIFIYIFLFVIQLLVFMVTNATS